ncbi:hypothetical protein [Brevibacillus sp. NRS-1366]
MILAFAKKGWILIVVVLGAVVSFVKKMVGKKNKTEHSESDEEKPSA